jgi:hypothetical protein
MRRRSNALRFPVHESPSLRYGFEGGVERLDQERSRDSGQARFEDQAAILGKPGIHAALNVLLRFAGERLGLLRASEPAHQPLDVKFFIYR